jgi:hypothetical protein
MKNMIMNVWVLDLKSENSSSKNANRKSKSVDWNLILTILEPDFAL